MTNWTTWATLGSRSTPLLKTATMKGQNRSQNPSRLLQLGGFPAFVREATPLCWRRRRRRRSWRFSVSLAWANPCGSGRPTSGVGLYQFDPFAKSLSPCSEWPRRGVWTWTVAKARSFAKAWTSLQDLHGHREKPQEEGPWVLPQKNPIWWENCTVLVPLFQV